jgi:hypothetical protein
MQLPDRSEVEPADCNVLPHLADLSDPELAERVLSMTPDLSRRYHFSP